MHVNFPLFIPKHRQKLFILSGKFYFDTDFNVLEFDIHYRNLITYERLKAVLMMCEHVF